MVQTCWYLFGHVCDWCAENTAVIIQNTYKTIGMLVTEVYIWPLSAVLNALANKIKKEPIFPSKLYHTFLETKQNRGTARLATTRPCDGLWENSIGFCSGRKHR